jgi:hypothetical protein
MIFEAVLDADRNALDILLAGLNPVGLKHSGSDSGGRQRFRGRPEYVQRSPI